MDTLMIKGQQPLRGTVRISGAKNAALPLMCASLLTAGEVTLHGVPQLTDVATLAELIGSLGAVTKAQGETLSFKAGNITSYHAPYDLVSRMRASVLVLGPLLARFGQAEVSLPGGCAIGARPVDVLLDGLTALGAQIDLVDGYIHARAEGGLTGADLVLPKPAVTGTENLMMAAVLAKGRTRIINAAREPEVVDLANMLNAMGASVTGAGTDTITIQGVATLHGCTYTVMPDRIEAGTYIIAAALMGEGVMVENARAEDNMALISTLRQAGVELTLGEGTIYVGPRRAYKAVNFTTNPFPGFATDLQAQMMLFMTQAQGSATIRETIYENRFMHVPELVRMGAKLRIDEHTVHTQGPSALKGATVMATDLRASASLVLAALVAEGTTTIRRVYHLDRGYEQLEAKLNGLGASVRRGREGNPALEVVEATGKYA